MARLGFFLPPFAKAVIRTHVRRVAPNPDILKDYLPTELPRHGIGAMVVAQRVEQQLRNQRWMVQIP